MQIALPRKSLAMVVMASLISLGTNGQDKVKADSTIETIPQLKSAIESVLKETQTPSAGVALVNSSGPVWIAGLGKADVEKNIDADSTTMYRIGSTSKMFVSLSILKLQEEGRLRLDDKVHDLVPDLAFENKWEAKNPIRIVHLLEHTTGWDDIHLCEYAHNEPVPISVKDGLAYHPHSRISRWVPGTRMSYCNAGPPAAALIVEKITGKPFEQYVEETFWRPMGMETMTYFRSETYKQKGAALYDNNKPQEYWNVIVRASGSINASPKDMAKMVQFFVDGAAVDSVQLVSGASLQRMETPSTTSGAEAGMRAGYGLSNYTSFHKGFVYQSHNGGVNGGLTDLSYLPGYKVGYAVMINAGNGDALKKIVELIRDFQTRELTAPAVEAKANEVLQDSSWFGYYLPINPRQQQFYFLERLLNVERIRADKDGIHKSPLLGGDTDDYLKASGNLFKSAKTGMTALVRTTDPLAGEVVHAGWKVLRHSSAIVVFGSLVILCACVLFILTSLLFAPIWIVRFWMGKVPRGATIAVRLWPLVASLSFVASVALIIIGGEDPFASLGKVSAVSLGIMIFTIAFALASFWSVYISIRERHAKIDRIVYWHSALVTLFNLIATIYLMWFGVIGMQTWA